jgi:hypothetical protein
MIHFHYNQPERNQSATVFPIVLIQQFYVDSNTDRHQENVFCLLKNVNNPHIQSIFLLNEREYTPSELGVNDPLKKIKQIVVGTRLLYADVFAFVRRSAIDGYVVFANTDIFLDESIAQLRHTNLHSKKQMYALLRYEYDPNSRKSQLFGPRYDSQDTWIFHSSQNIKPEQDKVLRFAFGKPGCDNKFIYVTSLLGYTLFNDPVLFKTHHYHTSRLRNYSSVDRMWPPYSMLVPNGVPFHQMSASFGRLPTADIGKWSNEWTRFSWEKDNKALKTSIESNRKQNTKYAVSSTFFFGSLLMSDLPQDFSNTERTKASSYYQSIVTNVSKDAIAVGKTVMEAYYFIHMEPWTWALRGSKLLIAVFESKIIANTLRDKWPIREHIYGCDLFPECTADIVFMETPDQPLPEDYDTVITDKETPFATAQLKLGKSVIGFEPIVLSMLFGIFNAHLLNTRPEVLRLYMNQHWTKIE